MGLADLDEHQTAHEVDGHSRNGREEEERKSDDDHQSGHEARPPSLVLDFLAKHGEEEVGDFGNEDSHDLHEDADADTVADHRGPLPVDDGFLLLVGDQGQQELLVSIFASELQ